MSFVGAPFTHDLFISYSHGSDAGGDGLLRPWSVRFVEELRRELALDRRFRDPLRIFLDAQHRPGLGIDPMEGLSEQLAREVGASALLMVLMSPDYLASGWCEKERAAWLAHQAHLGLPAEGRIAVVQIQPTAPEPWPAALCDGQGVPLVGFAFHDDSLGAPRPLGWDELNSGFGKSFRRALLSVVGRLSQHLADLQARLAERARVLQDAQRLQAAPAAAGQSIYQHGRAPQRKAWEDAANALLAEGFAVVPGDPDPEEDDPQRLQTLRRQRVDALAACDALLLLGTEDGRQLDADLLAVGRYDRHSARARSHRLLPCGVLDTVGGAMATPIRKATARNLQATWLDGTQPPWTPQVQQWLVAQGSAAEGRE